MENTRKKRMKEYAKMLLGFGIIGGFIFGLGPLMDQVPAVQPIITYIEKHNIEADALIYTEIEEFAEANIHMENTMDYPPHG